MPKVGSNNLVPVFASRVKQLPQLPQLETGTQILIVFVCECVFVSVCLFVCFCGGRGAASQLSNRQPGSGHDAEGDQGILEQVRTQSILYTLSQGNTHRHSH